MNEDTDFELYLSISPAEYTIYLYDIKNLKNFYKKNFKLEQEQNFIDFKVLNNFIEKNIFKIEKLIGKFVRNISLIIENDEIINIELGVKKKNYEKNISQKIIENTLFEIKDLFNENFPDYRIMHLILNNYLVNENRYSSYKENLIGDNFCLEVQIISIPLKLIFEIDKVMQNFHIKPNYYLSRKYVRNFFNDDEIELSNIAYKLQNGSNANEVKLIPKKPKKLGFFEKFFQLFS